jgi:hypothetical protein
MSLIVASAPFSSSALVIGNLTAFYGASSRVSFLQTTVMMMSFAVVCLISFLAQAIWILASCACHHASSFAFSLIPSSVLAFSICFSSFPLISLTVMTSLIVSLFSF